MKYIIIHKIIPGQVFFHGFAEERKSRDSHVSTSIKGETLELHHKMSLDGLAFAEVFLKLKE